MIKFLIKKSFFDAWDNLISLMLFNLGFFACFAIAVLPLLIGSAQLPFITAFFVIPGFILIHLYTGAASALLFEITEYKSIKFNQILIGIKKTWKASLITALLNSLFGISIVTALPLYSSMKNIWGMIGGAITFWIVAFWLLSSQYFFPVYIRMNGNILKSVKKAILITIDNLLFSFIILLLSILIYAFSILTLFIMPGPSSVILLHHDALKLRLYKYDWLEKNNDSSDQQLPWDKLLERDKEIVGHRTLKGMIFPWKS